MSCEDGDSGLAALSQPPFGEGQAPSPRGFHLYLGLTQVRQVGGAIAQHWPLDQVPGDDIVGLFQRLTPDTSWCANAHAEVTQENMNELSKNIPSSLFLILCLPSVDSCFYSVDSGSKKTKIPLFQWGSECRWGVYVCTQSH